MPAAPLPQRVDLRKAVARSDRYEGVVGVAQIPQLEAALDPEKPGVAVTVSFLRDEQGQAVADVTLQAAVVLECQRCLAPLKQELHSSSRLGLVLTDEQARQLPKSYEPWIAIDEIDLWDVAAEEFMLALPVVAYHPPGECQAPTVAPEDNDQGSPPEKADNPFEVLSALLGSDDSKEK